jgi:hypothetical protein
LFRARIRNVAPISRMPLSAIRTATAGSFRRSQRGFRDGPGRTDDRRRIPSLGPDFFPMRSAGCPTFIQLIETASSRRRVRRPRNGGRTLHKARVQTDLRPIGHTGPPRPRPRRSPTSSAICAARAPPPPGARYSEWTEVSFGPTDAPLMLR